MDTSHTLDQPDYSDLTAALARVDAQPLWDRFKTLVTREPKAPDAPHLWGWQTMLPLIARVAREVDMRDAERRVILLANPAFGGQVKTTTNLNAALQILEPGEHAHEHRHRLAAIRLVLEGDTAVTTVDGKPCSMKRGDLILTPAWTWHGHANDGNERVVWLDGLDLPLALYDLGVVSFEPSPPAPVTNDLTPDHAFAQGGVLPQTGEPGTGYSPLFRYSWESTHQTFESIKAAADGSKMLRYTNPLTGGAVMPTLDCYALELAANRATASRRSTYNTIVAVLDGEGETQIGSERIRWKRNDIFTIPHWNWVSHKAEKGNAHLFMMTDREVLSRLGYLVEEVQAPES